MGKESRRKRDRAAQRRAAAARPEPLKLAILTYPQSSANGPSLSHDVELVRAAVLYADEIELVSPGAVMLASVVQVAEGGLGALLDTLGTFDDDTMRALGAAPLPDNWRDFLPLITRAAQLDPALLRTQPGLQEALRHLHAASEDFHDVAEQMLEGSGGQELLPAFEDGILRLSSSGLESGDPDAFVSSYVGLVRRLLADPKIRLLFDDDAGSLVRHLVEEGNVEPHRLSLRHAGEAAVGSGLVARLPSFPSAPVDELLGLRQDLSAPLMRYRKAVSRFANQLSTPAFDSGMAAEIDDIWRADVEPALAEIEDELIHHTFVRELARSSVTDIRNFVLTGSAIYVALAATAPFRGLLDEAAAALGAAIQTSAQAAVRYRAERHDVSGHELFYLYEADWRLSSRN